MVPVVQKHSFWGLKKPKTATFSSSSSMDPNKVVYPDPTSQFTALLTSQAHFQPAVTHSRPYHFRKPAEGAPKNMNR